MPETSRPGPETKEALMRAFIVAAAIAGLLLTMGLRAGAESPPAPEKAKSAKSDLAKKKAKAKKRKAPEGVGGRGGMGGGPGNFGSRPPASPTETSNPSERRGSPEPVREPSPAGTRE